ncbi:hypothetical protein FGG08_006329 [Glutinoglossum americanum]|uniref:Heterokaryon incompatibility domain-containing protein n=1 Tax=Glutinoglossum americanum TaxID=1670608 RepID=A0A9P8I3P1_9PEZI|nr:hypothetical protein FGG08_006329 [Glutinoglossum americanum]
MVSQKLPQYVYKPLGSHHSSSFIDDYSESGGSSSYLSRKSFEIRVIELEPAKDVDAELHCNIKHITLDSGSGFEAISYVWGTPIFTHSLVCGDSQIAITPTLDEALRRFRLEDKMRTLWADAVCINQQDLKELGQQVQRMGQIYYWAREVLVWLGHGEDMDKCIDFMWGLSSSRHESCVTSHQADQVIEEELLRFFGHTRLEPIHTFLSLPWFTRRWVIQEAVLRGFHSDTPFYCGLVDITSHALHHAVFILQLSTFNFDRAILGHIKQLERMAQYFKDSDFKTQVRQGILEILVYFSNPSCADDRDRIYAFLGLADDIQSPFLDALHWRWDDTGRIAIEPDYEAPTEQVYVDFAERMLPNKDHLELLHCAGAFRPDLGAKRTLWQHWVPDWRYPMRYTPLLNVPWFHAGGKGRRAKPFINYPWCSVEGFVFDSVAVMFKIPGPKSEHRRAFRVMPPIGELCNALGMFGRYHTGERIWQVLAMTLVADHALNPTLCQRYSEKKSEWYDGKIMKRNARERDMNVLLDWWAASDTAANNGLESVAMPDEAKRQVELHASGLQRASCVSSFFKPKTTAGEWGPTCSNIRSGWHSRTDDEDLPYLLERMNKMAKESDEKNTNVLQARKETKKARLALPSTESKPSTLSGQAHDDGDDTLDSGDGGSETDDGMAIDGEWRCDGNGLICLEPHSRNMERYAELAHNTLRGRTFFITTKGYMGIGPGDMAKGDPAVILYGARTPFILRPVGSGGKWQLVGDCYIHGIMAGEAIVKEREKDIGFLLV